MNFKKDYINFVLYSVLQSEFYGVKDDIRVRKVLEKIISVSNEAKATYLAGKTAGLEILFKYLLYISDKIDKSQITIFNLKDNFDYDLQNLKRICSELRNIKTAAVKQAEAETNGSELQEEVLQSETEEEEISGSEEPASEDSVEINTVSAEDENELVGEPEELINENNESSAGPAFTLIENEESGDSDEEIFGLEGISRSVEMDEETEIAVPEESETDEEVPDEEIIIEAEAEVQEEEVKISAAESEDEIINAEDIEKINSLKEKESKKEEGGVEIEIHKQPQEVSDDETISKEVTSDVYYRFENKFFEEVKILEMLFSYTEKECKGKSLEKISEKTLQRFTGIIEISSELSNLARQLQLDLISDILLTINLLFTKSIKTPALIKPERIQLLNSSLSLVTSLIKGEDYLGYDNAVNEVMELKDVLTKPQEPVKKPQPVPDESSKEPPAEEKSPAEVKDEVKDVEIEIEIVHPQLTEETETEVKTTDKTQEEPQEVETVLQNAETAEVQKAKPVIPDSEPEIAEEKEETQKSEQGNTSTFKMKYLVKEFEKNFLKLNEIEGEYSKFDILDSIDALNSLLRMLAKVSASVRNEDVLKLSEVSYVFLKYLKDYKMDLLDAEIQQIIKYIIFTYKMLLTGRKPEDFEILVQYLNNPVKIFTDN